MKTKLLVLLVTLIAIPAAAAPEDRLTDAKVAADSGRMAEALATLEAVAADPSAPLGARCEAWVRQAGLHSAMGETARANLTYKTVADSHCQNEKDAMRLLVEAVTGVQQDPATWRGRTERVGVGIATGRAVIWFGDDPVPTVQTPPESVALPAPGTPLNLSVRDAPLKDVLRILSQAAGVPMRIEPPTAGDTTLTVQLTDVPWEQALQAILGTNGLRAEQDAEGIRIFPNSFARQRGDEALLQTVELAFAAYRRDAQLPVIPDWTPVAGYAHLVEPMFVRTLPRITPLGRQIQIRVTQAGDLETRVAP